MRTHLTMLIMLPFCSMLGAGVRLENERELFALKSEAGTVDAGQVARLSPDGKVLLYWRVTHGFDANKYDVPADYVLLDIASGKEKLLPVGKGGRADPWYLNRELFDPKGRSLVFHYFEGTGSSRDAKTAKPVMLYDAVTGRAVSTGITTQLAHARIDSTGRLLVASDMIYELGGKRSTPLHAPGHLDSVSPLAAVGTFFKTEVEPGGPALVLWNLQTDRLVASLPMSKTNHNLEAFAVQWTSDGRFFGYSDSPDKGVGETVQTRVWDVRAGRPVSSIERASPLAPGPGADDLFLRRWPRRGTSELLLHHVGTRRTEVVPIDARDVMAVRGRWIVFTRKVNKIEHAFMAEVVAGDAPATQSTREGSVPATLGAAPRDHTPDSPSPLR